MEFSKIIQASGHGAEDDTSIAGNATLAFFVLFEADLCLIAPSTTWCPIHVENILKQLYTINYSNTAHFPCVEHFHTMLSLKARVGC